MNKQPHLILSVRFLTDRYHGCVDNGQRPEWPPSPWRLFQALIAGNARGADLPERLQAALRWLENLDPPIIVAPSVQAGKPVLTYVPNNTGDKRWPPTKAPKALRPTLLNGDRLVEFIWSFDSRPPDAMVHAGVIAEAAGHVQCLGWGVDMAVGRGEVTESWSAQLLGPRTVYRPTEGGEVVNGTILRVPRKSSLQTLESAYRGFIDRYKDKKVTRFESPAVFARRRYAAGDSGRPWVAFELRRADNGDRFAVPLRQIARLTGRVRHACAQAAGGKHAPGVAADILGHPEAGGGSARVSIMVLPTVRDGPTDGRIRRIVLAEPYRSDGRWIKVLRKRLGLFVLDREGAERHLPPLCLGPIRGRDGVLRRYVATAREWVSVTPILLPGFDDPGKKPRNGTDERDAQSVNRQVVRLSRAERLMHKSLRHAGISAGIQELVLSKVPFVTGARHVRDYHCHRKLQHYPRYFARIVFTTCLSGPLALGAGRHAGFGALAAVE